MIAIRSHKKNADIIVADDVKAIFKEEAENIVKPFVSGNEARTSKSGSALASIILAKHKGSLYVDNNIQGYTKGFVAKLPQRTLLYILLK